MYTPTWKQHERAMREGTPDEQIKATEAFLAERDKELKVSEKAREFEKSRRERVAKEKPQWIKEKRQERDPILDGLKTLKDGGQFNALKPVAGYILIKPIAREITTGSGLILADDDKGTNIGLVISVGKELALEKTIMKPPVKEDDTVMYKWFAGIDVLVGGEEMKIMQFSDMLAVIE